MSETSPSLGLPYIQPAQAQKHVTHNEALRLLDALVQPNVIDRTNIVPPATPTDGDRYIVPAGATGAWAAQDGNIALADAGNWSFFTPQKGWLVTVQAETTALIWNGTEWTALEADFQNLDALGVNTTADATNRLAVSSASTLLTHDGGDHRVVVNKASPADTASLLFQSNWQGRAEMGISGSDDFDINVSDDNSTWNTGLKLDAATGKASFPSGVKVPNRTEIGARWSCFTDNRWVTHNTNNGVQNENATINSGTGVEPNVNWTHQGFVVKGGTVLQDLHGAIRYSSAETTGYDLRVFFQTGPWSNGWTTNSNVTRTQILAADGVTLAEGFNEIDYDLNGFETPASGFILTFFRPIGTITATRYFNSSISLTYLTP